MDLRSDTVTKPSEGMLEAMFQAEVGDDVFDEDPTVKQLEDKVANLFGMQAALYCPSGTMTNQIAVRVHTNPQDQVICDQRSHVYNYEGGGMAFHSGVSVKLLDGDRGRFTAEDVQKSINPVNIHFPISKLVLLENTVNKGGGSYYNLSQVRPIHQVCQQHDLRLHLDGARLFNALAETKEDPKAWGKLFNTISICLSKGLGAPIGSVLCGSSESIQLAKRVRKVLGGGMRQVGYLAAAGIYALDHHLDGLEDDHRRAKLIGEILQKANFVKKVYPVDTNIIIFETVDQVSVESVLDQLKRNQVLAVPFGGQEIRMVTHREITDTMIDQFEQLVNKLTYV